MVRSVRNVGKRGTQLQHLGAGRTAKSEAEASASLVQMHHVREIQNTQHSANACAKR